MPHSIAFANEWADRSISYKGKCSSLDVWYLVAADALPPSASLRLYPHRRARHARIEQYRDAWHYLLPDPSNATVTWNGFSSNPET